MLQEIDESRRKEMNDALRRIRSVSPIMKNIAEQMNARAKFGKRGLTERTIRALADCPIDYPERLLFMTEKEIQSIPGIGKVSLVEIIAYREKFIR
jgi:DNA-directed RNA polymerase alpha subunit